MINEFTAQNYGCLQDINVKLTRFHAFVGGNGTGKTTLLRAVQDLVSVACAGGAPRQWPVFGKIENLRLSAMTPAGGYTVMSDGIQTSERVAHSQGVGLPDSVDVSRTGTDQRPVRSIEQLSVVGHLAGARFARWTPAALAGPGCVHDDEPGELHETGHRLSDALAGLSKHQIQTIFVDWIQEVYPEVAMVGAVDSHLSADLRNTVITCQDGSTRIGRDISDGLLCYLGTAALIALPTVSVVLIDNPAAYLHPANVEHMVARLRVFSEQSGTQVLMATHNPLVINCMHPKEVTLLTLRDGKTVATPMLDTGDFKGMYSCYSLGKLWLSHADGQDEKGLISKEES